MARTSSSLLGCIDAERVLLRLRWDMAHVLSETHKDLCGVEVLMNKHRTITAVAFNGPANEIFDFAQVSHAKLRAEEGLDVRDQ